MEALRAIDAWPARRVSAAVVDRSGVLGARGDLDAVYQWASVTKLVTALTVLVAVEEGVVDLDEPAGPSGSTVRHLLAHASGLPPDGGPPLASPGARRIYSNVGFEELGRVVSRHSSMRFADYAAAAACEPLGMAGRLHGSPAYGMSGSVNDLIALARELLEPALLARETLEEATSVAFPGLTGVLPGFGRQEPNDWGLGFELRDEKSPHWTGSRNSPRTFGHFGRRGTFLWVDPEVGIACACLTNLAFGEWAKEAWPQLSDAVVGEVASRGTAPHPP